MLEAILAGYTKVKIQLYKYPNLTSCSYLFRRGSFQYCIVYYKHDCKRPEWLVVESKKNLFLREKKK